MMSGQIMTFPDSVDEFMESYKMVDTEHIYSNGTEYVPIFRMRQWFEHMNDNDVVEVTRCKDCVHYWKNGEDVAICLASPKDDAFCSEGERRGDDKGRNTTSV